MKMNNKKYEIFDKFTYPLSVFFFYHCGFRVVIDNRQHSSVGESESRVFKIKLFPRNNELAFRFLLMK